MVKGVILTPRDQVMIRDVYDSVALSLSQIRDRHFAAAQMPTVCNRLAKLRSAGFIEKTRVGIVLYRGQPREIGTIYQVAKKGVQYLAARFPDERFRAQAPRVHFATLAHDLTLSDVMRALGNRFPDAKITHGKLLGTPWRSQERQPDAVMESGSGEKVAIELELSAKSEQRYREIVLQYRLSQSAGSVLYVMGSKEAENKLKNQIIGYKSPMGVQAAATGKFYFVALEALLKAPATAPLSNGSEDSAAWISYQNKKEGN